MELEASLIYRVGSGAVRYTQRNCVLKEKKKNPRENESIILLVDKSVVHFLD